MLGTSLSEWKMKKKKFETSHTIEQHQQKFRDSWRRLVQVWDYILQRICSQKTNQEVWIFFCASAEQSQLLPTNKISCFFVDFDWLWEPIFFQDDVSRTNSLFEFKICNELKNKRKIFLMIQFLRQENKNIRNFPEQFTGGMFDLIHSVLKQVCLIFLFRI